jgi:hypothetical protein
MRTVSDMKETIQETVDFLDSFQPVFDLWVKVLRIKGIPYTRVRMAMIREDAAQLRLFSPGKPRRP